MSPSFASQVASIVISLTLSVTGLVSTLRGHDVAAAIWWLASGVWMLVNVVIGMANKDRS